MDGDDAGEAFIHGNGKAHSGGSSGARTMSPLMTALFGTEARTSLTIFAFVLVLGVALGVALPPDNYPEPYGWISSITGWVYFSAWSVSFWPQIFLNWSRKSVVGLSFDYLALNLLGFTCYATYNLGYAYNPGIRAAYQAAHGGSLPAVQTNDVFFAVHAVAATLVTVVQCFIYERAGQRVSYTCIAILVVLLIAIGVTALLTAQGVAPSFSWLEYLLFLSYVKLAISLMKYTPQVVLNCRRRSTAGWTIHNVLLDFVGGSLSLAQLIMDCKVSGDWSGIAGDPVKFGLGLMSMVYDVVFMVQHYCLFAGAREGAAYDAVGEEGEDVDDVEGGGPVGAGGATGPRRGARK